MKLIVECSQKLVRLGENLWSKEQKLDKEMQEHQKLCDEIMAIQGIEPIEAEMEEVWHCPEGYIFKDENGNVINTTKIVLEKKKKEYPQTYEECCEILEDVADCSLSCFACGVLNNLQKLLLCRDAYWKIYGEENGLGKPWEPDWTNLEYDKFCIWVDVGDITFRSGLRCQHILAFPTEEMRGAFYENFKKEIEICKEFL